MNMKPDGAVKNLRLDHWTRLCRQFATSMQAQKKSRHAPGNLRISCHVTTCMNSYTDLAALAHLLNSLLEGGVIQAQHKGGTVEGNSSALELVEQTAFATGKTKGVLSHSQFWVVHISVWCVWSVTPKLWITGVSPNFPCKNCILWVVMGSFSTSTYLNGPRN